jgi:hypothetical protein
VSDIVTRLRRWTHAVDAEPASDLMDHAADEIENLRTAIRRLAEQDATLSVCEGNVTVEMDGPCPYVVGKTTLHCSLTPLTLTTKEREAIHRAIEQLEGVLNIGCIDDAVAAAALRDLLERTK